MKKVSQARANMESKMVKECFNSLTHSTLGFKRKEPKHLEYAKYLRDNIIEKEWFLSERMNTEKMLRMLNQYIMC